MDGADNDYYDVQYRVVATKLHDDDAQYQLEVPLANGEYLLVQGKFEQQGSALFNKRYALSVDSTMNDAQALFVSELQRNEWRMDKSLPFQRKVIFYFSVQGIPFRDLKLFAGDDASMSKAGRIQDVIAIDSTSTPAVHMVVDEHAKLYELHTYNLDKSTKQTQGIRKQNTLRELAFVRQLRDHPAEVVSFHRGVGKVSSATTRTINALAQTSSNISVKQAEKEWMQWMPNVSNPSILKKSFSRGDYVYFHDMAPLAQEFNGKLGRVEDIVHDGVEFRYTVTAVNNYDEPQIVTASRLAHAEGARVLIGGTGDQKLDGKFGTVKAFPEVQNNAGSNSNNHPKLLLVAVDGVQSGPAILCNARNVKFHLKDIAVRHYLGAVDANGFKVHDDIAKLLIERHFYFQQRLENAGIELQQQSWRALMKDSFSLAGALDVQVSSMFGSTTDRNTGTISKKHHLIQEFLEKEFSRKFHQFQNDAQFQHFQKLERFAQDSSFLMEILSDEKKIKNVEADKSSVSLDRLKSVMSRTFFNDKTRQLHGEDENPLERCRVTYQVNAINELQRDLKKYINKCNDQFPELNQKFEAYETKESHFYELRIGAVTKARGSQ